jgi:hypothetical protein
MAELDPGVVSTELDKAQQSPARTVSSVVRGGCFAALDAVRDNLLLCTAPDTARRSDAVRPEV